MRLPCHWAVYARSPPSVHVFTVQCTCVHCPVDDEKCVKINRKLREYESESAETNWEIPQLKPGCLGDELSRVRDNNLFIPHKDTLFRTRESPSPKQPRKKPRMRGMHSWLIFVLFTVWSWLRKLPCSFCHQPQRRRLRWGE